MGLDDYIEEHIDAEPDYLHRLWRATNLQLLNGRMASGHQQGRLLRMLVRMIRPQTVLEVGTFSGYSALCLAEGLPEGGHLWTFEVDDELLRHEAIHTCQMLETGFVGFYVWYLTEWLLRLAWRVLTLYRVQKKERRHHLHGAYAHLLFEREAYCHAAESDYLSRRRPYAWLIG